MRQNKSEELLRNIAEDVKLSEDERIRLRNMLIKVKKIQNMNANQNGEDLEEKKLLGSGGHALQN